MCSSPFGPRAKSEIQSRNQPKPRVFEPVILAKAGLTRMYWASFRGLPPTVQPQKQRGSMNLGMVLIEIHQIKDQYPFINKVVVEIMQLRRTETFA